MILAGLSLALVAMTSAQPSFAADYGADEYYQDGPDVEPVDDEIYRDGYSGERTPRTDDQYQDRYAPYANGPDVYDRGDAYDDYADAPPVYNGRGGSLKDGDVDYRPVERRRDYAHGHRYRAGCFSQRQIHRQLRRAGWSDFQYGRIRGRIGMVEAVRRDSWHRGSGYRGSGALYELAVDGCSGEVLYARPIARPNGYASPRWRRAGLRYRY